MLSFDIRYIKPIILSLIIFNYDIGFSLSWCSKESHFLLLCYLLKLLSNIKINTSFY